MSEQKPSKRFVSRGRYIRVLGSKISLYTFSLSFVFLGASGLMYVIWGFYWVYLQVRGPHWLDILVNGKLESDGLCMYGLSLVFLLWISNLFIALLWSGKRVNVHARQIDSSIAPITNRNAHLLPLQNTLVRASNLHPTEQPSELLRASQTGLETPPEELLRSVAGDE